MNVEFITTHRQSKMRALITLATMLVIAGCRVCVVGPGKEGLEVILMVELKVVP